MTTEAYTEIHWGFRPLCALRFCEGAGGERVRASYQKFRPPFSSLRCSFVRSPSKRRVASVLWQEPAMRQADDDEVPYLSLSDDEPDSQQPVRAVSA
jgi:hypothetical protein